MHHFDIAGEDCNEDSRYFFNAMISGTIARIPTRNNLEQPTFFSEQGDCAETRIQGMVRRVSIDASYLRCILPDGYEQVCGLRAGSALFTTTAVCGKVDLCSENDEGEVVVSLEDPLGYTKLEINLKNYTMDADGYLHEKDIVEGNFLLAKGDISIYASERSRNAVLRIKRCDVTVESITKSGFHRYVNVMSY